MVNHFRNLRKEKEDEEQYQAQKSYTVSQNLKKITSALKDFTQATYFHDMVDTRFGDNVQQKHICADLDLSERRIAEFEGDEER